MYNWNEWAHIILRPILQSLLEAYNIPIQNVIRLESQFHSLNYDVHIIGFYYKFLYETPRANQLDQILKTYVCTHYSPSYPGGQAMVVATILEWFSLLFPQEKQQFNTLNRDCANSRHLAGVHYEIENFYGAKVGRKIGRYFYNLHKNQRDENGKLIDKFLNPVKRPVLKLNDRIDTYIPECTTLLDERSLNYLSRLKASRNIE